MVCIDISKYISVVLLYLNYKINCKFTWSLLPKSKNNLKYQSDINYYSIPIITNIERITDSVRLTEITRYNFNITFNESSDDL